MDQTYKFRHSADEKTAWDTAAANAGLSLSAWIRATLNAASSEPAPKTQEHPKGPQPIHLHRLCPRCQRIGRPSCPTCRKMKYQTP